jgi:hypothetical protein
VIRSFPALLLVACISDQGWQGGTGVGNPGTAKLAMARADGLELTSASARLDALDVERCRGGVESSAVAATVDLLDDGGHRVAGGRWCALVARFTPPLVVEGTDGEDAPATFALELDVAEVRVEVSRRLVVDRDALVLELGPPGWLDEEVLGLGDGEHVDVGPGDPAHDALVAALEQGSALFVDADRDGELSATERAAGPVASGGAEEDDE